MNVYISELKSVYFEECADLLSEMEANLIDLEAGVTDDLLNAIFRCAHSIKGGSGTFGFTDVSTFTHSLETLLDLLRKGQLELTPELTQLLLSSVDHMTTLLAAARGDMQDTVNTQLMLSQVQEVIDSVAAGPAEEFDEDEFRAEIAALLAAESDDRKLYRIQYTPKSSEPNQDTDVLAFFALLGEIGEVMQTKCDTADLPPLESLDPLSWRLSWHIEIKTTSSEEEIVHSLASAAAADELWVEAVEDEKPAAMQLETSVPAAVAAVAADISAQPKAEPARRRPETASKGESHVLRIPADKVDKLINLVGELVIHQAMLNEIAAHYTPDQAQDLAAAVADVGRATRELQERVMGVRMLPIRQAFARFNRLVHDLSAAVGKKVDLRTSGEDTELDKTLIEGLADPLTHLVRNSIDHGIETPAERIAAGKPEFGTVSLSARHEGSNIIIEVNDDGRGLSRDRIRSKAVKSGLIAEDEAISDEALYNLIYHPGFSTADQVTDISGRGVGMDIVVSSIRALGGAVSVTSEPGTGATFRIRLPLTMAILEGLSVAIGGEVYILPLTSILESIRPKREDVHVIAGGGELVNRRTESLPVIRLHEHFRIAGAIDDCCAGLLVIVENDGHKAALLVNDLIGQNQIVVKNLETNYGQVAGIAGATILGNGRVGLILDVPSLLQSARRATRRVALAV